MDDIVVVKQYIQSFDGYMISDRSGHEQLSNIVTVPDWVNVNDFFCCVVLTLREIKVWKY